MYFLSLIAFHPQTWTFLHVPTLHFFLAMTPMRSDLNLFLSLFHASHIALCPKDQITAIISFTVVFHGLRIQNKNFPSQSLELSQGALSSLLLLPYLLTIHNPDDKHCLIQPTQSSQQPLELGITILSEPFPFHLP